MGRSRSSSRSSGGHRSPRRRSGGRRRSRSNNSDDGDGTRVHVSDIPVATSKAELEKTFEKFGPLMEVWKTNSVPCFAFVVFMNRDDAEDAIRSLNGQHVFGSRVRVTMALPRARERQRRGGVYNSDARCYQCGMPGHFSRSCKYYEGAGRNRMMPSPPRRRFSPPKRYRQRSRTPSRSRSRSPSNRRRSDDRYASKGRHDRRRDSRRDDERGHGDGFRGRSHSKSLERDRGRGRSRSQGAEPYEDDGLDA